MSSTTEIAESAGDHRRITLAVLLHSGRYTWKHPGAWAEGDLDLDRYLDLARTAERGLFDIMFLADAYSIKDDGLKPDALRGLSAMIQFEPTVLFGALATVTKHIGMVTTGSTTYNQPYDLARRLATLDHMSGGRVGWNVITSQMTTEALNFNLDAQLSNADRYARAREFLEVALGLWDSWDEDAFPRDKATGVYADPDKMRVLDHRGRFFKVRGPLNIARMPQGYPVICQAGESEAGQELAAQFAEMMYCKVGSVAHGQEFYARVKGRMAKFGRSPEHLKLMPGLLCVVGRTTEEAYDKFERVQSCITEVEAREFAVQFMGPAFDLPDYDPNDPLPALPELAEVAARKRMQLTFRGKRLSLVGLGRWISANMGHLTVIGTPGEIADTLQAYVDGRACDGFALMPHYLPGNLEDFVDLVVPELQKRRVFRTAYEGRTLRENLGLPQPAGRSLGLDRRREAV